MQPESGGDGNRERKKRRREECSNNIEEIMSKKKRCYSKCDPTYESCNETPKEKLLRKTLIYRTNYYKQKIRTLLARRRNDMERITRLKSMMQVLQEKNLINEEHAEILNAIGESNVELFKHFIPHTKNKIQQNTKNSKVHKHTGNTTLHTTTAKSTKKGSKKNCLGKFPHKSDNLL